MKTMSTTMEQKLDNEIHQVITRSKIIKESMPFADGVGYLDFFNHKLLVVQVIREGIPYSLFANIQDYTPFTENDWSDYLSISTKSLQRYKKDLSKFKPIHSEKIIELAEVTNLGVSVFGDVEKFKLWLNTPSFALGSNKPKELLKDSYGKELVVGELTRIDHGILS
ncbi:antitoxin Xre/MbcA/ParS toxin-binding domain-containing protein [Flavobacterium sp.]|uniref:type II RES/Xre toxin-antitoxin system antitoxin n=1 Tax=Flavobacterium sp. TaxID=239 RepID=UPI001225CFAC|nr:antitoxin Xre/MbcA/ParS toxin-binding domain-containing protein [Flavobacterium sp.]RZJ71726.1 MAG: DUF2384 domain-containing protein [Flavobacterium sp.]